jgi:hypothetical protein
MRFEGEQLIMFGIKNAPAESIDADLRKFLLVGFIVGLKNVGLTDMSYLNVMFNFC